MQDKSSSLSVFIKKGSGYLRRQSNKQKMAVQVQSHFRKVYFKLLYKIDPEKIWNTIFEKRGFIRRETIIIP